MEKETVKILHQEFANAKVVKKRAIIFTLIGLTPVWAILFLGVSSKSIEICIISIISVCIVATIMAYQLKNIDQLQILFTDKGLIVAKGNKIYKEISLAHDEKIFVRVKGQKLIFKSSNDKHRFYKRALSADFLSKIESISYHYCPVNLAIKTRCYLNTTPSTCNSDNQYY